MTGKARHGKTTFSSHLINELAQWGCHAESIPISTTFKTFWASLNGVTLDELELYKEDLAHPYAITHRHALEQLGDWGRSIDKQFWLNAIERTIALRTAHQITPLRLIIVPDIRVESEAVWIRERGVLTHIHSDTLPTITSDHTVQTSPIAKHLEDIVVYNNGTIDQLIGAANSVCQTLVTTYFPELLTTHG